MASAARPLAVVTGASTGIGYVKVDMLVADARLLHEFELGHPGQEAPRRSGAGTYDRRAQRILGQSADPLGFGQVVEGNDPQRSVSQPGHEPLLQEEAPESART